METERVCLEPCIALGARLERFGSIQRVRSAPTSMELKHVPITFQG